MPKPLGPIDGPCPFDAPYCGGHIHHCRLCSRYAMGEGPPNFPPPAIPIRVGFMPAHHTQIYPSAYWYVASYRLLWSFFKEFGLVIEF